MKEPVWLYYRYALALHYRVVALSGRPDAVRDDAPPASALARPRQLSPSPSSAVTYALSSDYPSVLYAPTPLPHGNKRTAFLVGILFLELNGYRFAASEEDAAKAVIALASGALSEAGYLAFLQAHSRRA